MRQKVGTAVVSGIGDGDDQYRALAERVRVGRRRFLGLVGAGTGVAVLGACSSSGGSDGNRPTGFHAH